MCAALTFVGTATLNRQRYTLHGVPHGIDLDGCDLPRYTEEELGASNLYFAELKGRRPFVLLRPLERTAHVRHLASIDTLRDTFGDTPVVLSSSNSFSHGKLPTTLRAYLDTVSRIYTGNDDRSEALNSSAAAMLPATETFYLFGDSPLTAITGPYPQPLDAPHDDGLVVWGAGRDGSGVAFHTHGAAWGEVLIGAKRWYLAAPSAEAPRGWMASETHVAWVAREGLALPADMLSCTCFPGEVIYVPPMWWHATLNLDGYNAFVSTFTQEHRGATRNSSAGSDSAESTPAVPYNPYYEL